MEREQLPPLIGSPKQVAWANTVRARLLAKIDAHERDIEANVAKRCAKEQRSLRFHRLDQSLAFAGFAVKPWRAGGLPLLRRLLQHGF